MKVGNLVVQHIRQLPSVITAKKVDVGVIAVPAQAAQSVADLMIVSNIEGASEHGSHPYCGAGACASN